LLRRLPSAPVKNTSERARMYSSMPSSDPKECTDSTQPASMAGISAGCGFNAQWRQIFPLSPSDSPKVGSSSSIAAVSKPMPWFRRCTPYSA
jgi:hypothetical protein